jgi:hypothetical protein
VRISEEISNVNSLRVAFKSNDKTEKTGITTKKKKQETDRQADRQKRERQREAERDRAREREK